MPVLVSQVTIGSSTPASGLHMRIWVLAAKLQQQLQLSPLAEVYCSGMQVLQ